MPKIRIVLEDVTEAQAELIQRDLAHLSNIRVTVAREPPRLEMPELTPEQQKAFEEEWTKASPGHIVYLRKPDGSRVKFDPGPAVGDTLTVDHIKRGKEWIDGALADIDADEDAEDIVGRITNDVTRLYGMIDHLQCQLQAEGAHTEAANAEIERLKARLEDAQIELNNERNARKS